MKNVTKHEKLGKYFPYCTRDHMITTTEVSNIFILEMFPIIEFSVVPSDKLSKIKVSLTLSSRCKSCNYFLRYLILSATLARMITVDTGRKLNVHKTFRRRPGRPMYVQFMSCVYGDRYCLMLLSFVLGEYNAKKQFYQKFYKIIYFFAKFDIS